jgi:phenylalanyl-tRNA synthetase alpha subunit
MDNTNLISKEKFLCGLPTEIEGLCLVYPLKLREIAQVGIKNFYTYLNIFTLSKEDVDEFVAQNNWKIDISPFQFHLGNALADQHYYKDFCEAFKLFLHVADITILQENEAIILDNDRNRVMKEEQFNVIQQIIRAQNCVDNEDDVVGNKPANEKAAEIIRKIQEGKRIRAKNKKESSLEFYDLVASLAAGGNNLNIINVWDLTYYAFNDQFRRMQMKEEYENNVQSLLAGADSKKIKLKHWIRKIQDKEES